MISVSEKLINEVDIKQFVIAGGVSANSKIRSEINRLTEAYPNIKFSYPQLKFCGDNAAMIGAAAYTMYKHDMFTDLQDGANPSYRKLI